jgi:hypothetical protein
LLLPFRLSIIIVRHVSPVPDILVKTVPEHVSPPIFKNKKKFPFLSPILGTIKMTNFCLKREIRDKKKKERNLDGWTDGWTDGRTKEREIDKQI